MLFAIMHGSGLQQWMGKMSYQLNLQHASRPKVWNVGCRHALFDLFILQHLRASLAVSAANAKGFYPGSGATSITKGRRYLSCCRCQQ